ncbi:MAG: DUF1016 N-terminal domain-containing protein [Candidatus Omnitrophota bacterium]
MKSFSVTTYAALRRKVEETLLRGQRKIEEAKVLTYWQTGRYINQHVKVNGGRAEYGEQVILRLSEDLKVGDDLLYRCSRFAALLPISASWRKLTWSHLRALCRVSDDRKRLELLEQAVRNEWPSAVLETKIRNLNWEVRAAALEGKPPSLPPVPALGPFYTYQVIAPQTVHSSSKQLLLDLGFSCRLEMEIFQGTHFPAGTILESKRRDEGEKSAPKHAPIVRGNSIFKLVRSGGGNEALYTYKAFVQKFIDADTFHVEFRLGFGQLREETIRLKGVDCPEINTPEGKAAKRFVERELGGCEFITVKSTQTRKEKWGRYLADLFYQDKSGKLIYLNNLLLEKGHAVRVRG